MKSFDFSFARFRGGPALRELPLLPRVPVHAGEDLLLPLHHEAGPLTAWWAEFLWEEHYSPRVTRTDLACLEATYPIFNWSLVLYFCYRIRKVRF